MDSKKITSWLNWNEWKSVADGAYNFNDRTAMQKAFDQILAWESRDSNLPAAILCLKELLISKLRQIDQADASIDEIYGYKSSLAMNIVRFVNFITEPYQTSIYAKPIKTIAHEIGLPDWIVNLRHNATHYSLPSFEILENAREFLFVWLKENYIDTYKEIGFEPAIIENMKLYFHELFVNYINASYKKCLTKKSKKEDSIEETYHKLQQEIQSMTWHFRNEAFEIVLEDGFLVPTKTEMNAMGLVAEEFLEQSNLELPKQLLRIWTPYLAYCNEASLMSLLFQKLVSSFKVDFEAHKLLEQNEEASLPISRRASYSASSNPSRSLRAYFLLAWIVYFLKTNSYKLPEKQKNSKFYFELNVKETFVTLFESISSNMGMLLVNELNRIPVFMKEIGVAKLEKVAQLVMIMADNDVSQQKMNNLGPSGGQDDGMMMMDTSLEDYNDQDHYLNEVMNRHFRTQVPSDSKEFSFKSKVIRSHLSEQSDWKTLDDATWNSENTKLGLLDGQTYSNLNLDLGQFMSSEAQDEQKAELTTPLDGSLNQTSGRGHTQMSASMRSVDTAAEATTKTTHFFDSNKKPSSHFVDTFKNTLIRNYWEN